MAVDSDGVQFFSCLICRSAHVAAVNRIRLLPEHVANQIAAGEVVERPASVAKELVENALDAGSTRIHVEIAAGGRSLIRVTDDGWGMSKDDALLCLERHATSKIQRAEDLAAVRTMGFRGEAVPSIASVSRFTLTTRERDDTTGEGSQIVINGGRILEVKAAGCAAGTVVEVRSLFFNLPARRKFLRAEETERVHLQHYLILAALAHPQVGFTFTSDGRTVWQLPPVKWSTDAERLPALRERLRTFLGADVPLLPVDFHGDIQEAPRPEEEENPHNAGGFTLTNSAAPVPSSETSSFRLWGFLGAPGVSRSTRDDQYLFVNQRPVENRSLSFALVEGYHTALMKGRFPVACLFLEIDPAAVDVNVHPQKREVKFREEMRVRRLVAQGVRETLLQFASPPAPVAPPPDPAGVAPTGNALPARSIAQDPWVTSTPSTPEFQLTATPTPRPVPQQPGLPLTLKPLAVPPPTTSLVGAGSSIPVAPAPEPTAPHRAPSATAAVTPLQGAPTPLLQVPLRLLGILGKLYVLLESDRGLVLMDQHAAHERVLYEQMLSRLEEAGSSPSQRLLLPETVELSPRDAEFVRRNLDTLARLGVGLSEFGDRTFLLDALPPTVKATSPRQFACGLIDDLKAAGNALNVGRLSEHVVAKTVCRHAVKANDTLRDAEVRQLVDDLRRCAMPYTCPHGRPTLIEMNWKELERKFGRVA